MSKIILRKSRENELEIIITLIKEFAIYIEGTDTTDIDREALKFALFYSGKVEHRFIELDNKIIGYITFFYLFSTFKGRFGLYLEDIYT